MPRYGLLILLLLSLGSAPMVGAQAPVPSPVVAQYPNIRAALDDGFYSLAEQLSRGVLRANSNKEQRREATLLLTHALWGQKRYSEMLSLLKDYTVEADFVYWRARALYELKRFDEALGLLNGAFEPLAGSPYAPAALRLKGQMEQGTGKLTEAEASFRLFIAAFPEHPDRLGNQFDLAETLAVQSRVPEALAIYETLATQPETDAAQRAQLKKGHLLYLPGPTEDVEAARAVFSELTTHTDTRLIYRIDAYVDLAALEEMAGQQDEAAEALRQGIALSPDARQRVPLKLALARLLLRTDDTTGALSLLEECRAEVPNQTMAAELQLEKAGALLQAKRFAEAVDSCQVYLAVADDPAGLAQAQFYKGLALLELDRFAEASTALDKAATGLLKPDHRAVALFKAGDAFYLAGRYEEAEKRYRSFVIEFPNHGNGPNAQYQLGLALSGTGRRPDALEVFQSLEKEHVSSPFAEKAALRSADLFWSNNQWDAALEKFAQISRVYTNSPTTQAFSEHQRGQVLYRLGRYAEAQQAFEGVLEKYPESEQVPQATYLRGFCLTFQGKVEEGIQTCTDFVENYPDSEWTPEVIFWLAERYFNLGDYAESEPLFLRIASEFNENRLAPRALYWAGRSAAAQSSYVKAIEHYSAVAKTYSKSEIMPQMRFAQGDALTELGEFSRAILAFDEIIKKYPETPLVNAAWGRKGDCQFSLAVDHSARYAAAMASYQAILDRPTAPLSLKLQAEYKMGRCLEKTGAPDAAFNRYMGVVYTFKNEQMVHSSQNVMWFTRSAFEAAKLKERGKMWVEAVQVYERVVEVGVPSQDEALKRIKKIKKENWLLFQEESNGSD